MAITSAVRGIFAKKPISPTSSPARSSAIASSSPVRRTASAPCSTMNNAFEGPPCATSISPRTRSWRTMALKVFSRCSELSVRNSAKSSSTFPHPSVALGPLIGGTRFDYRAPMLAPGGRRGERYKGDGPAPRYCRSKRICPSAGRISQMRCKTYAAGRDLARHPQTHQARSRHIRPFRRKTADEPCNGALAGTELAVAVARPIG